MGIRVDPRAPETAQAGVQLTHGLGETQRHIYPFGWEHFKGPGDWTGPRGGGQQGGTPAWWRPGSQARFTSVGEAPSSLGSADPVPRPWAPAPHPVQSGIRNSLLPPHTLFPGPRPPRSGGTKRRPQRGHPCLSGAGPGSPLHFIWMKSSWWMASSSGSLSSVRSNSADTFGSRAPLTHCS